MCCVSCEVSVVGDKERAACELSGGDRGDVARALAGGRGAL